MPETDDDTLFGKLIAKAWRDPAFKADLIANPAAALKAEGVVVSSGMTVTVLENTDKHFHLVLPPAPTDEPSDDTFDEKIKLKLNQLKIRGSFYSRLR
jgi:hypothetical protein